MALELDPVITEQMDIQYFQKTLSKVLRGDLRNGDGVALGIIKNIVRQRSFMDPNVNCFTLGQYPVTVDAKRTGNLSYRFNFEEFTYDYLTHRNVKVWAINDRGQVAGHAYMIGQQIYSQGTSDCGIGILKGGPEGMAFALGVEDVALAFAIPLVALTPETFHMVEPKFKKDWWQSLARTVAEALIR